MAKIEPMDPDPNESRKWTRWQRYWQIISWGVLAYLGIIIFKVIFIFQGS